MSRGLSYSSLRAGKQYWLKNFGERYEFEILEILHSQDFFIKDLTSLEQYKLSELTQYGTGKDFEIRELY